MHAHKFHKFKKNMLMNFFCVPALFLSLLIHTQLLNNAWIGYATGNNLPLIFSLFAATSYLLYPLCGWIAEVYLSNFKLMRWSFISVLISSLAALAACLWLIQSPKFITWRYIYAAPFGVVVIITGLIGYSMFEANAIQFGMDQMLEASSNQLSSFIHWYFWCAKVGPLFVYYVFVSSGYIFSDCKIKMQQLKHDVDHSFGWITAVVSCVQITLSVCGIIFNVMATKWVTFEETSRNSLKIIFRVLYYSYKHRRPERRSAFTYWEDYTPSRIDLGKEKYGGPFTYEQVEDVKTMFRLLLLMLSLFGYHLSGDGYSLTYYVMKTVGCPKFLPSALMIFNPQHVTLVMVVLGIPFFQLLKKWLSHYLPSLLNRIWWGLFFCLLSECIQCNYSLWLEEKEFKCPELHTFISEKPSLLMQCITAHIKAAKNNTCEYVCSTPPVDDHLIYISSIPLVMNGFSYLLIFVTTVEFICAQSPNAMKGLLIGVWYSLLSVKFAIVNNLDIDSFLLQKDTWIIYHATKGLCIFVSIVLFSMIYRRYKYRERDEIVNEQTMIEEQYERELLLNSSNAFEHS